MEFSKSPENIKYNGWGKVWSVDTSDFPAKVKAGQNKPGKDYFANEDIAILANDFKDHDQVVEFMFVVRRIGDVDYRNIIAMRAWVNDNG